MKKLTVGYSRTTNLLVLSFFTGEARFLVVTSGTVAITVAHPVAGHAGPVPALELTTVTWASSADTVGARILIAFEGVH